MPTSSRGLKGPFLESIHTQWIDNAEVHMRPVGRNGYFYLGQFIIKVTKSVKSVTKIF